MGQVGFGADFAARSRAQVEQMATPPSGQSEENIWHQLYDTQTFTSGTTVRLTFFQVASADRTLSNNQVGGTLQRYQAMRVYDVCLDVLSIIPVTTAAGGLDGVLNDLALLIFGSNQRPTWELMMSDKRYGPYSLTTLHGTGGPVGFGWGTFTAEESIQYARNDPSSGWNYRGRIIIAEQTGFDITLVWAATATMSADKRLRVSLFGALNRRVL